MTLDTATCPDGHGLQQVLARESVAGGQNVTLSCGYKGPYRKASMAPPAAVCAGNDLTVLGTWRGSHARDR